MGGVLPSGWLIPQFPVRRRKSLSYLLTRGDVHLLAVAGNTEMNTGEQAWFAFSCVDPRSRITKSNQNCMFFFL